MRIELTNIKPSLITSCLTSKIRGILSPLLKSIMKSKMKILCCIFLLFWSFSAWSQPWQDALKSARESYLLRSYEQAVSQYRTAQKLAPKNIDISIELAQSLYKAGKYEEAERLYSSQLNKKFSNVSNSDLHRQVGNSRMHQDKYKEAIDSYKNALRSDPSDQISRHNLAKAIEKKQEKENPKPQNQNQNSPDTKDKDPKPEEDNAKAKQEDKDQQPNSRAPKEPKKIDNPTLSDIRTERLLEELSQKEKQTKRNMNSKIGDKPNSTNRTKKDW
jgi:Ca-activated chloride channel family protein